MGVRPQALGVFSGWLGAAWFFLAGKVLGPGCRVDEWVDPQAEKGRVLSRRSSLSPEILRWSLDGHRTSFIVMSWLSACWSTQHLHWHLI